MRISAKDREDAEVLCLLRAEAALDAPFAIIDASDRAIVLANSAWFACAICMRRRRIGSAALPLVRVADLADIELEAAALIRDGWCPGDLVVRLGR